MMSDEQFEECERLARGEAGTWIPANLKTAISALTEEVRRLRDVVRSRPSARRDEEIILDSLRAVADARSEEQKAHRRCEALMASMRDARDLLADVGGDPTARRRDAIAALNAGLGQG